MLVLLVLPYDFLLDEAGLHKSQFCATISRRITQGAILLSSTLTKTVNIAHKTWALWGEFFQCLSPSLLFRIGGEQQIEHLTMIWISHVQKLMYDGFALEILWLIE